MSWSRNFWNVCVEKKTTNSRHTRKQKNPNRKRHVQAVVNPTVWRTSKNGAYQLCLLSHPFTRKSSSQHGLHTHSCGRLDLITAGEQL